MIIQNILAVMRVIIAAIAGLRAMVAAALTVGHAVLVSLVPIIFYDEG